jgi:hypothetical protein
MLQINLKYKFITSVSLYVHVKDDLEARKVYLKYLALDLLALLGPVFIQCPFQCHVLA